MKVVVVSPGSSWILDTIARKTCQAHSDFTHVPLHPDPVHLQHAEAVIYWDVQGCWSPGPMRTAWPLALHVGCYTHIDRDDPAVIRGHYLGLDGVVHMCQRYFDVFAEQGWYSPERMIVLRPGQPVPGISLKPLRIGICQRGGHVGKGKDFLPQVAQQLAPEIRAALQLVFCGQGWGSVHDEELGDGNYYGIPAIYLREVHYQMLYELVDVLLIPSLWEGGPMALLEALAAGLPVIAADVGWVPEFFEDVRRRHSETHGFYALSLDHGDAVWYSGPQGFWVYPPGNVLQPAAILTDLVQQRLDRRAMVEEMTYARYAAQLLAFCERLQEMSYVS